MEDKNFFSKLKCVNGTTLKIIAMISMFIDHLGKTLINNQDWTTCVGRLAFPIFAFQIAEGYKHTKDYKAYLKRMFVYALISEIPFNMLFGSPINPMNQNVLFTFCIALIVIRVIDQSWKKHWGFGVLMTVVSVSIGYILGFLLCTDYMGYGVLMVTGFWLFGRIKFGWVLQLLMMIYVNWEMIAGLSIVWMINGQEIWIPMQAIAIFAMIPILMYNGEKGPGGKRFQRAVYIFYPAHCFVLGAIMMIWTVMFWG